MTWETPKTDWTPANGVADIDLNRIEGNIKHLSETVVSTGTDINTLITDGRFFVSSPVNGPDGTGSVYVQVSAHTDPNFILQNAYSRATNKVFTRRKEQGTWTAWTQVSSETIVKGVFDINTLTENGTYLISPASTGSPNTVDYCTIEVFKSDNSNYVSQIGKSINNSKWYSRSRVNGTWSAWMQLGNETMTAPSDLNNITENGVYYAYNNTSNTPTATDFYYIEHRNHDTDPNWRSQTAYYVFSTAMYIRIMNNGTWGGWMKMATGGTVQLTAGTDINTILTNGVYDGSALVNKPVTSSDWIYLEVMVHSNTSSFAVQRATELNTGKAPRVWVRQRDSGTWSPWKELGIVRKLDFTRTVPWAAAGLPNASYWKPLHTIGVGNYAYTVVGINEGSTDNQLERYDPLANTFTTMAAPPANVNYNTHGICSDGTYIYAFATSRFTSSNIKVYRYNIAANTWSTLADAAAPVTAGSYQITLFPIIVGDYIYFVWSREDANTNYWYCRVHKTTGVFEYVQETNFLGPATGSFYENGNYYVTTGDDVMRISTNTFNLANRAQSGTDSSESYYYTPAGNPYVFMGNGSFPTATVFCKFSGVNAEQSAKNLTYQYVLETVSDEYSFSIFIPGLGRIVSVDGTYQDIGELINY